MTQDIPPCDPDNLPAEAEHAPEPAASDAVVWWALVGLYDPPLAVGRTPDEAEQRLFSQLLHYYRVEADPLSPDPLASATRELQRWKQGALLAGFAREELAAFLAWRMASSLSLEEALLRWREVFAAPEGPDPLAALVLGEDGAPAQGRRRRSTRTRPPSGRRGGSDDAL